MDTIASHLSALLSEGGSRNRLLISAGDVWLALSGERGGHAVECEPITDDSLPSGISLTTEQRKALLAAGFTPIKHSSRLRRIYGLDGSGRAEEVASILTGLLAEVYGEQSWTLSAWSGSKPEVRNPEIIQQMRRLSRTRSHGDRMKLYRQLLRADLLVPVEAEDSNKPAQIDDIAGFPVFGAFTDLKSVLYFDPRALPLRVIPGRAYFPMLMKQRAGSLRLNPGAIVGGELYRNELESIAGAAMRITLR